MKLAVMSFLLFAACVAAAQTKGRAYEYQHSSTTLQGYLAMPKTDAFPVPMVIIIHDWNGLDNYEKRRADMLADLGYAALAADIYGKGVRPKNREESAAQAGKYRNDPVLLRGRLRAALDAARQMRNIDRNRIAVMGYCFGGGAALELARSGAPIAAAISFHGNLNTKMPATPGGVKGKVLVLHGADDPGVPMEQVNGFIHEMRNAKVDWHLIMYGNAVHSFTEPGAGSDPSRGAAYNRAADERSWEALQQFLSEVLLVRT